MTTVVIALGSNVGDSARNMRDASTALHAYMSVIAESSTYRTAPMYVENQPDFLNSVLLADTDLGPRALLKLLKNLEQDIGRQARERYGPREIDLDLIAYGSVHYSFLSGDKPLFVPHPKTAERRFVLEPLCEIAPAYNLVGLGIASDLLAKTNAAPSDVVRIEHADV